MTLSFLSRRDLKKLFVSRTYGSKSLISLAKRIFSFLSMRDTTASPVPLPVDSAARDSVAFRNAKCEGTGGQVRSAGPPGLR